MSARRYRLAPRVALEAGPEDGGVLVDTRSATLCACNASAWTLLEALLEGATVDELAERLGARFDVDPGQARRDTLDFVRRLGAMGLVDQGADRDEPA